MSAHETLCGRHTKHWWVLLIRVDGLLLSLLLCRHQRAHLHSSSVEARPFTSSSAHFKTFFFFKKTYWLHAAPFSSQILNFTLKTNKKGKPAFTFQWPIFFSSMRVQKRSVFTWIAGCCCKSVSEIQSKNEKKERSGNITRLYRLTHIQNKSLTIINNPLLIIIKTLNTPHLTTVLSPFFVFFCFFVTQPKVGPFCLSQEKN